MRNEDDDEVDEEEEEDQDDDEEEDDDDEEEDHNLNLCPKSRWYPGREEGRKDEQESFLWVDLNPIRSPPKIRDTNTNPNTTP